MVAAPSVAIAARKTPRISSTVHYNSEFMPQLLEGKTVLILGVANKWSIAFAIAQAFQREGARLMLTYQGERLKGAAEELGSEVGALAVFECDVSKDDHLVRLGDTLKEHG